MNDILHETTLSADRVWWFCSCGEKYLVGTKHSRIDRAHVILFKESGKFYTEEFWTIPDRAIGPYDMRQSPDFRRIGNGAVLVPSQEPWGFPQLFPSEDS